MAQIQQVVIIRRNQFATFARLAQAFADEPDVRRKTDVTDRGVTPPK